MIESLSLLRAQTPTVERPLYIRTVPRLPRRKRASLLARLRAWATRTPSNVGCCA